jgi:hypothetical protein
VQHLKCYWPNCGRKPTNHVHRFQSRTIPGVSEPYLRKKSSIARFKRSHFISLVAPRILFARIMDQLAWHRVHKKAFKRLGGVAAVNRIDNLKKGVAHGSGIWGQINEAYAAYARTMGFHVDPHQVRQPNQKSKVERRFVVCTLHDYVLRAELLSYFWPN